MIFARNLVSNSYLQLQISVLFRLLKKIIFNDYVYCSLFVTALLWVLLMVFNINRDIFGPFSEALADFEVTDLAYNPDLREEPNADTNVVLVNIANFDNRSLAQLIANVNQYEPKVIGLNTTLYTSEDGLGDTLLSQVLGQVPNLVLASRLEGYSDSLKSYTQWITSDSLFTRFQDDSLTTHFPEWGYSNLPNTDRDFRTTREFNPTHTLLQKKVYSFGYMLSKHFDENRANNFIKRNLDKEIIKYRGNFDKFFVIDAEDALNGNFDPSLVRNKVIVMGYIGDSFFNEKFWDSKKFYTPLNKNYAGKTFPDMYETVIQANIVSMILSGEYVNRMSFTNDLLLNIIICFHNVVLFSLLFHAAAIWWDAFSMVIILVESVVMLLATVFLYSRYNLLVNLNVSLVFVLVLPNFLELYYGLFKVAIQKYAVKFMIVQEDKKRNRMKDMLKEQSSSILKDLNADMIQSRSTNDKTDLPPDSHGLSKV